MYGGLWQPPVRQYFKFNCLTFNPNIFICEIITHVQPVELVNCAVMALTIATIRSLLSEPMSSLRDQFAGTIYRIKIAHGRFS